AGTLFWPHRCPGCGRPLTDPGESVCLRCLFELPRTGFLQQPHNPVEMLFWGRTPVDAAGSLFYFSRGSAMQRILHALKYRGNRQAGVRLGRSLGEAIGASGRFSPIDAIIPVPLHPEREKIRGYNQAECIARGIAVATGWPVWTGLVNRIRQTDTQTRKNRIERWSNLSDGFRLSRPEHVAGKHLLIVDDVITTGASLEACAHGILQASPAKLCIATIAYATQ
ncbi:MAG: ComF family protein, partial [bacterium]